MNVTFKEEMDNAEHLKEFYLDDTTQSVQLNLLT